MNFLLQIYSHRGFQADGSIPENSIPAFEAAIQQGADGFEFDVHLSRDGKAVVFHDKTLNKVGVPKLIQEMNLEELEQIELAEGISLPPLADVIERFGNKTFLNIEIKTFNAAAEVVKLIHHYELECSPSNIIVSSFLKRPLAEIKKIDSQIPTGLLYSSVWGKIKLAKALNCEAIHPFFDEVPNFGLNHIHKFFLRRNINIAQKQGFLINAWTVNSPKLIEELLRRRITGIITDNLKEAIQLREKHALNLSKGD